MGNTASTRAPRTSTGTYPVFGATGILGAVQSQDVSAALQTLGEPSSATMRQHREVLVEAGGLGLVRLFIELKCSRHGRSSHYFWSAYRAEPAKVGI